MLLRRLHVLPFLAFVACGTSSATLDGGSIEAGHDSGLPSGQCRVSEDCAGLGSAYFCGALVLPPMCGGQCEASSGASCKADSDCADAGAGMICSGFPSRGPCYCPHGGAQPRPACTKGCSSASDCGAALTCDATHRCVAAACTQPSDCANPNFTCASNHCVATTCTRDSDCATYCVMGSCSAEIGSCAQAVP